MSGRRASAWQEQFGSRLLPGWGVRGLGVVALALALGVPFVAGALGWVRVELDGETGASGELRSGELRPRMIALPGGTFMMGSPDGQGKDDEHPQHEVRVGTFELCETEVSVRHYWLVTGERPSDCNYGCEEEHPVQMVSWFDAAKYLNALTRLENRGRASGERLTLCYDETTWAWDRACTGYRLPTEAEWEYAARAGTTTTWSFGDDVRELCKHANVSMTECEDGFELLAPVKTTEFAPNPWFLHDMHGNVWEWVYDGYAADAYASAKAVDPVHEEATEYRVLRGGSFNLRSQVSRSAVRDWCLPEDRVRFYGFRCARGAVPQP